MYQIDNSTAASVQPAPTAPGTPGFFTDGSIGGGVAPTVVPAEWFNAVQQELINVLVAAGITPSKSTYNQLAAAIAKNSPGRLLGITIIASTGTFTPNPLANSTRVRGAGAGGGGAGCVATGAGQASIGSGGSCGAYAEIFISSKISSPVSVTVGAGGTSVAGANGNTGGSSVFGTYLTLPGGGGGNASPAGTPPFFASGGTNTSFPTISGATAVVSLPGVSGGAAFAFAATGVNTVAPGRGTATLIGVAGAPPVGTGSGGNGSGNIQSLSAAIGSSGIAGAFIVEEYA